MPSERSPATARRAFLVALAGASAGTVAGCVSSDESTRQTTESPTPTSTESPTPTTEPPDTPEDEPTEHYHREVEIYVHETGEESVAEGVLRGEKHLDAYERDLIRETIEAGPTTFTAIAHEPLSEQIYVERDGSYYSITRSVAEKRDVTAHAFGIDAITTCPNATPSEPADPVPFDDLSEADRRTFTLGLRDYFADDACFGSTRRFYYSPDAEAESAFVGSKRTYVRHEEDTYVVEYRGTKRATLTTFRYEATHLGDEKASYVEQVVPAVVWHVDPASLPEDERGLFEHLVDEGYYEKENPIPEYVDSFLGRVVEHAYAHVESQYYLEHDGTYFRLRYSTVVT